MLVTDRSYTVIHVKTVRVCVYVRDHPSTSVFFQHTLKNKYEQLTLNMVRYA